MSRWQVEFEQHPFQADWAALSSESLNLTVDDETVLTTVEELARLKRVIAYLKTMISTIDVELAPKSIWDNFQQQCGPCLQQVNTYKANRNIAHLQAANQHLDNLLSYVRPYLIPAEQAATVFSAAASSYKAQLSEYIDAFLNKSVASTEEIASRDKYSKSLIDELEGRKEKINAFAAKLLEGSEDAPAIKDEIAQAKVEIERKASEIDKLFNLLLVDAPESKSLRSQVDGAKNEIADANIQIQGWLKTSRQQLDELELFYGKIFGTKNEDDTAISGLEFELDTRIEQLDKLEKEQIQKYGALLSKIESLLPGATSAGLARAYQELRRSFSAPIKSNTNLFYFAVAMVPIISIVASIESLNLSPVSLKFITYSTVEEIIKAMLLKAPFVAPLVWLAIFASTRRSQYERLRQEYAHKEALAKSYESYKKQLASLLSPETDALQRELIAKSIEAISFNASATLDGKHQEKCRSNAP